MDIFELLIATGMSKKEAAVYDCLLQNGSQSLSAISKETHINRPALYQLLPKMQREGVISQIKKQKRVLYEAESPKKILTNFRTHKKDIESRLESLAIAFEHHDPERPKIKYMEGAKGLTFVFDDVAHTLPVGGTFFRYTSRVGSTDQLRGTYYDKIRDEKKLERLVIASEEKTTAKPKKLERSVKAIPKDFDLFEDNISLVIYGDKTAYIDYSSKTSFIVESAKIARFQEKLFRLLWKQLGPAK